MAPTIARAPAVRGTHQAPRPLSRSCAATFQTCQCSLTLLVPPARLTFLREIDGRNLSTTAGCVSRVHSRLTPLIGYYSHNQQFPSPNKRRTPQTQSLPYDAMSRAAGTSLMVRFGS